MKKMMFSFVAACAILALGQIARADSLSVTANPTSIRADGKSTSALTVTATVSVSSVTKVIPVGLSVNGPGTVNPVNLSITIPEGSFSGTASSTLNSTKKAGTVTVTANSWGFTPGSVQVTTYKGR